jgi:hypothetical protein
MMAQRCKIKRFLHQRSFDPLIYIEPVNIHHHLSTVLDDAEWHFAFPKAILYSDIIKRQVNGTCRLLNY